VKREEGEKFEKDNNTLIFLKQVLRIMIVLILFFVIKCKDYLKKKKVKIRLKKEKSNKI
jgi:hypothetical protein